jgi:hypothetical protein
MYAYCLRNTLENCKNGSDDAKREGQTRSGEKHGSMSSRWAFPSALMKVSPAVRNDRSNAVAAPESTAVAAIR